MCWVWKETSSSFSNLESCRGGPTNLFSWVRSLFQSVAWSEIFHGKGVYGENFLSEEGRGSEGEKLLKISENYVSEKIFPIVARPPQSSPILMRGFRFRLSFEDELLAWTTVRCGGRISELARAPPSSTPRAAGRGQSRARHTRSSDSRPLTFPRDRSRFPVPNLAHPRYPLRPAVRGWGRRGGGDSPITFTAPLSSQCRGQVVN